MGAFRRYRKRMAWLALVALLGNVLAALVCPLPFKAQASDYPADLLGPLIICSQTGADRVEHDKAPDHPNKPCQLCIVAAGVHHALAPTAPSLDLPATLGRGIASIEPDSFVAPLHRAGLGSRGPPLQA